MTILLVRKSPPRPGDILERLHEAGVNILGPVSRASHALLMAAQHHADLALIEPELAGVRSGHELARDLEATWGVRSLILDEG